MTNIYNVVEGIEEAGLLEVVEVGKPDLEKIYRRERPWQAFKTEARHFIVECSEKVLKTLAMDTSGCRGPAMLGIQTAQRTWPTSPVSYLRPSHTGKILFDAIHLVKGPTRRQGARGITPSSTVLSCLYFEILTLRFDPSGCRSEQCSEQTILIGTQLY